MLVYSTQLQCGGSVNTHQRHSEHQAEHRTTILVVEDTPTVRHLFRHFLQSAGFRVLMAPDGYAAQVLVQSGVEIDLVLLDYNMPGMNGAELAQWLLDVKMQVPIVLISGSESDVESAKKVLPSVICRMKPFTAGEILDLVRGVLADRASQTLG